jgi:hypothetical protein
MSQSVGFEMASRGTDSMRIVAQGPFGITVGMALLTQNNFIAYNALNNSVYRGSTSVQSKFPLFNSLPPSLAFNVLLGIFELPAEQEADSFTVSAGRMYSFIIRSGKETYDKYYFDGDNNRITQYVRMQTSDEKILWNIYYAYKKNETDILAPETITIAIPNKETTITVEYDNIVFNKEIKSLKISHPKDAEEISVQ